MSRRRAKFKPWHEYEHLAFDVDGTLIDSNLAHVWAWQDAIEAENLFFPHVSMLMQIGMPGHRIVEKFSYYFKDAQTRERIAKNAKELYVERYVRLASPFHGIYDLLGELRGRGRKLYAITSASKKEAQQMFESFELEEYFTEALTSEESGEGKPTPEPFLRLKEMLGARADIISIGDSPYDLKASSAAGIPFVFLGQGGFPSSAAGIPFVFLGQGGFPREWFTKAHTRFLSICDMLDDLKKSAREAA